MDDLPLFMGDNLIKRSFIHILIRLPIIRAERAAYLTRVSQGDQLTDASRAQQQQMGPPSLNYRYYR